MKQYNWYKYSYRNLEDESQLLNNIACLLLDFYIIFLEIKKAIHVWLIFYRKFIVKLAPLRLLEINRSHWLLTIKYEKSISEGHVTGIIPLIGEPQ